MQQKVTPAMVIVAIIVVIVIVVAVWYFTMGKKAKTAPENAVPEGQTMQPTSPEEAQRMGIKPGRGVVEGGGSQ